ncbi:unnamed protein product [Camellia sinensis]
MVGQKFRSEFLKQREVSKMDSGKKPVCEFKGNVEIESAYASSSLGTHHYSFDKDNKEYLAEPVWTSNRQSQQTLKIDDLTRASDLLMAVSVRADVNKQKILNLAMAAVDELKQLAIYQEAFWVLDKDAGTYVLNEVEYKKRFSPLDPTLEEILRMLKTEGPIQLANLNDTANVLPAGHGLVALQTEASHDIGLVNMNPPNLVYMFMDVEHWAKLFSTVVSKAKVLEIISMGQNGDLDGALQVMTAEFHVASPLVETRESYFARYCRQLGWNTWVVVDVSLESIFPNPAVRFVRKPSGCFIQGIGNGYSKVTWIEHIEVDNTSVHYLFKPLVTSGFAFSAQRWVGTLARQCDRVAAFMDESGRVKLNVTILRDGRKNLLILADRMMRSYHSSVSSSPIENLWQPIPVDGGEDIMVTTKHNFGDDSQTPVGVYVTVATTIWVPAQPRHVFHFLRNGDHRNMWDLLSVNLNTREIAHVTTSRDLGNCVSIIAIDTSPLIFYMQESQTNLTGSYVVYAPVDILAMNSVLDGGDPDKVQMLSSGFAILPDRPTMHGEEIGGTLLTIAFQILDESVSTRDYLPSSSVATLYTIITRTAAMIRARVIL